jgi:hypothetical protein
VGARVRKTINPGIMGVDPRGNDVPLGGTTTLARVIHHLRDGDRQIYVLFMPEFYRPGAPDLWWEAYDAHAADEHKINSL